MTRTIRPVPRRSFPALMIFGAVYLATLAIVLGPDRLRTVPADAGGATSLLLQEGDP